MTRRLPGPASAEVVALPDGGVTVVGLTAADVFLARIDPTAGLP